MIRLAFISVFLVFVWGFATGQNRLRLAPPIAEVPQAIFEDSVAIALHFGMAEAQIEWKRKDGDWMAYAGSIVGEESEVYYARTTANGFLPSEETRFEIIKMGKRFSLLLVTPPSEKYPGISLRDGIKASGNFQDPQWMGFDAERVVLRVKVEEGTQSLRLEFLNDPGSWILLPESVELQAKTEIGEVIGRSSGKLWRDDPGSHSVFLGLPETTSLPEYWEIIILPADLPEGHPGAGKKAWIFVDEILAY